MYKTNTENYKTFLSEIKEDLNKWRDRCITFINWKVQYCYDVKSPKLIYRFNVISINIPAVFL